MRTKKRDAAKEVGEAEALNAAADTRLAAAKKLAQAKALERSAQEDSEAQDPETPSETADFIPREAFDDCPPTPAPEPSKLDTILEKVGGEGKVEIYRMVAGQWSKCGVYPIEDYPEILETLATKKGGGTFKSVFKDRGGHIRGQDTQSFDADTYAGAKKEDNGQSEVLSFMKEHLAVQQREIAALRSEQTALMLKVVEGATSGRPSHSASELAELLKVSREMNPPSKSPFESIKEVLEMVAVLKTDGAVGEPPDPLTLAIDKGLRIIEPLLGAWAAKLSQAGSGAHPVPPSSPAEGLGPHQARQALPPPLASEAAQPLPLDPAVVRYAQSLYQFASQGASFKAVAESILTLATTDEDLDQLDLLVSDPSLLDRLLQAEPRLSQHRAWIESLTNHLRLELQCMEDPEPTVIPGAPASPPASPGAVADPLDKAYLTEGPSAV